MGNFLDDLWHEYHTDDMKNELFSKLHELDKMLEAFEISDNDEKEKFKEAYYDFFMQNKVREKEAFCEGVHEGCKLMLNKM